MNLGTQHIFSSDFKEHMGMSLMEYVREGRLICPSQW